METKSQKTRPDKIKVVLELKDGKTLKAEGETVLEALQKLPQLEPLMIKSTGMIYVEGAKGKTSRFLNINKVKALFNDKIKAYKEIFAKSLETFLK